MPDPSTSLEVTKASLILSPDAPINQKLIEYEDWLQSSLLSCTRSIAMPCPIQEALIKEITQAIQEVYATKAEEWSHQ